MEDDSPVRVPIEDAIDLHSFAPRDVVDVVDDYLRAAHEAGFREVRLIHLVRQRFGSATPILIGESPAETLDRARATDAIAIVELQPLSTWWIALSDDPALRIFDSLGDLFQKATGREHRSHRVRR